MREEREKKSALDLYCLFIQIDAHYEKKPSDTRKQQGNNNVYPFEMKLVRSFEQRNKYNKSRDGRISLLAE